MIAEKFAEIITKLNNDAEFTSLNLSNNNLNQKQLGVLCETLEKNTSLHSLNLAKCKIDSQGAALLAKALEKNHSLKSLDLSHNLIKGDGAKALATMLKYNQTLTSFSLAGNGILSAGTTAIVNSLQKNTVLTSLDLSNTNTTSYKKYNLCLVPHKMQHLLTEKLYVKIKNNFLQYTVINPAHEINIDKISAAELKHEINENLTEIELTALLPDILKITTNRGHTPTNVCLEAIVDLIQSNHTLTSLNLANSRIDAKSLSTLADALEKNHVLTELGIDNSRIKTYLKRNAEEYANQYVGFMTVATQAYRQACGEGTTLGDVPLEIITQEIKPIKAPAGFKWTSAPSTFFTQHLDKTALEVVNEKGVESLPIACKG